METLFSLCFLMFGMLSTVASIDSKTWPCAIPFCWTMRSECLVDWIRCCVPSMVMSGWGKYVASMALRCHKLHKIFTIYTSSFYIFFTHFIGILLKAISFQIKSFFLNIDDWLLITRTIKQLCNSVGRALVLFTFILVTSLDSSQKYCYKFFLSFISIVISN